MLKTLPKQGRFGDVLCIVEQDGIHVRISLLEMGVIGLPGIPVGGA